MDVQKDILKCLGLPVLHIQRRKAKTQPWLNQLAVMRRANTKHQSYKLQSACEINIYFTSSNFLHLKTSKHMPAEEEICKMKALEGQRDGTCVADVLKLEPGGWWIKIQTQLALTSNESHMSIGECGCPFNLLQFWPRVDFFLQDLWWQIPDLQQKNASSCLELGRVTIISLRFHFSCCCPQKSQEGDDYHIACANGVKE